MTLELGEVTRLSGQLRHEPMRMREVSLVIRFDDFSEVGSSNYFREPQLLNSFFNTVLKSFFCDCIKLKFRTVLKIQIELRNLARSDVQAILCGRTNK